ncbi:MAG: hypothetical protein HC809_02890 [Gammaproteobacteria bacterium]|nr:hypothetical protein [Gammaproteobacteria bacterium]
MRDLLKQFAVDFVPETVAAAKCINDWLAEQSQLPPLTPVQRGVGLAPFEVRGRHFSGMAQPYRFYLLGRVQAAYDSASMPDRQGIDALLRDCDLTEVLGATISRQIGRDGNLEVWL